MKCFNLLVYAMFIHGTLLCADDAMVKERWMNCCDSIQGDYKSKRIPVYGNPKETQILHVMDVDHRLKGESFSTIPNELRAKLMLHLSIARAIKGAPIENQKKIDAMIAILRETRPSDEISDRYLVCEPMSRRIVLTAS